jgi:hypothetical protein
MNSHGSIHSWRHGPPQPATTEIQQCMERFAEETRRHRAQLRRMDHSESTMQRSDSGVLPIREDHVLLLPGRSIAHMCGVLGTELSASMNECMSLLRSMGSRTSSSMPTKTTSRDLPFCKTNAESLQAMSMNMEDLYDLVVKEPWFKSNGSLLSFETKKSTSVDVTATMMTPTVQAMPLLPTDQAVQVAVTTTTTAHSTDADMNGSELVLTFDQGVHVAAATTTNVEALGADGEKDTELVLPSDQGAAVNVGFREDIPDAELQEPLLVHEPEAFSAASVPANMDTVVQPEAVAPTMRNDGDVTDQDVLLGRGGLTNRHPGNRRYLEQKRRLQPMYFRADKKWQKTEIARELVDWVYIENGRFKEKDELTGKWKEVSLQRAREKASQALREGSKHFPKNVGVCQIID